MIFNSFEFLIFSFFSVLAYWILPVRWSKWFLLVSSMFFYASFISGYTFLIAVMTLIVFHLAKIISHKKNRALLFFSIGITLTPLIITKYLSFLFEVFRIQNEIATFFSSSIIAPLGISFFTFEFIHYLVDVYKGHKPMASFLDFSVFIFFFPTQLAGPIKRFENFIPELRNKVFSTTLFVTGIQKIIMGLFQKVVLADSISHVVSIVFDSGVTISGGDVWIATFLFAFQIFFDFSGYSLVAIGLANCFGFSLPSNFDAPYLSRNVAEFWNRWHISLMGWFRDYLYIPLGGSRRGQTRQIINTFFVFLISGLWHGASWHFILWGVYHSLGVVLSRAMRNSFLTYIPESMKESINILFTFLFVSLGWVFFRAHSINAAFTLFSYMLKDPWVVTMEKITYLPPMVLICTVLSSFFIIRFIKQDLKIFPQISYIDRMLTNLKYSFLTLLICIYFIHPSVQFIYFQF